MSGRNLKGRERRWNALDSGASSTTAPPRDTPEVAGTPAAEPDTGTTGRAADSEAYGPDGTRTGAAGRDRVWTRPRSVDTDGMSTADLIKLASEQASRLARGEMKLAQAELRAKGRHAGIGAGMFGAAGMVALYGVAALITAAIFALALVLPNWLAALIVGVVLFLIVGGLVLFGRSQLRRIGSPYPERAVASAKADAQYLKERAGR
ncbi:MAG: phage holin family protein [Micromonosporaceae bacterium]